MSQPGYPAAAATLAPTAFTPRSSTASPACHVAAPVRINQRLCGLRRIFMIGGLSAVAAVVVAIVVTSRGGQVDKYGPVVQRIAKQTGTPFRPASEAALKQLRDLKFPEPIVAFDILSVTFSGPSTKTCPNHSLILWTTIRRTHRSGRVRVFACFSDS